MGCYREISKSDISNVKRLLDEHIGKDFYSAEYIEGIVEDKNRIMNLYISDEGKVLGFQYGMLADIDTSCNILNISKKDRDKLIQEYPECAKGDIGIFKTIAVAAECRGRGVSNHLNEMTTEWFEKRGVRIAIGVALIRPDGVVNARYAMEHANQRVIFNVEQPWIKIKSYCPYCQQEYCHCNGAVFIKRVQGED